MKRQMFVPAAGLVMSLVLPALNVAAQDTVEVTPLVLENQLGTSYFPAPDGRHILYETGEPEPGLMLVDLAGESDPVFIALPQENGEPISFPVGDINYINRVSWSPDSTRFAVAGTDYQTLKEGDLWVYSLETSEWSNLTDDGYGPADFRAVIDEELEPETPFTLEIQPTWSPDGTQIAVERYSGLLEAPYQAAISVVDLETGEVRDLAPVPPREPDSNTVTGVGSMSWSPDGTGLYVAVMGTAADGQNDGIYYIDAVSGEMTQRLSYDTMIETYTEASGMTPEFRIWTSPIRVSPDGQHALLWIGAPRNTTSHFYWPFVLNLETNALAPLVSFEQWKQPESTLFAGQRPLYAAWSPDGQQVLLGSLAALPPDTAPALTDENGNLLLARYDIQTGEAELLGFVSSEQMGPTNGVWSADNRAIIGGFEIQLPE